MKNVTLKVLFNFLFVFFLNNLLAQNLSQNDIRLIADEVNTELKGKDIGNGISLRNCIAVGRTLNYNYDVPEGWLPSPTIKEDLQANFRTSGILNFYSTNGISLKFLYFNGNSLVKVIEINKTSKSIPHYELADYVNLKDHAKSKDVNLKLKSPKNWQVLEGDRPNIVKKFVDDTNVFLVLIKNNVTFFSRNEAKEILSNEEFTKDFINESGRIFTNYSIHNKRIISIDTYPTLEYLLSGQLERSGITMEMIMKVWVIFYEDKLIHLQASGVNNGDFEEREQLYTSILNSAIFSDQYNY